MSCMKRNKRIEIDWNKLLGPDDDKPPQELVVITTTPAGGKPKPLPVMDEKLQRMTDRELEEATARCKANILKLAPKLPDKGEKLKLSLKRHEEEFERREKNRLEKDLNECYELTQVQSPSSTDASCGKQWTKSSKSTFTSIFGNKLNEKQDSRTVNAFEDELICLRPCDRRRTKPNGQCPSRGRDQKDENGVSLRQRHFRCPSTVLVDVNKQVISNGEKDDRHSSSCSPHNEDGAGCCSKRKAFEDQPSRNLRPRNTIEQRQTLILVDGDVPQLVETTQQAEDLDESMKDIVIYYPSSNDPESVEISYLDMECLAPEAFLSSPIINFYIRYLQNLTSLPKRATCDYHFFNTYFYKKLKEAVLGQPEGGKRKITIHKFGLSGVSTLRDSRLLRVDRETSFEKFRRWWRGVNIFEKAYILFPVHENLHWSLVIICFPDKEEESGPILLHLDSLGLHYSRPIFDSIKSFLKEEWNYLRKEEAPLDLPITDKIWQNLPRRMDDKIITVPQQRNDYDCGIFVLFFMERFIEEAPKRLNKKNIEMFGKKWFKPEEASSLRNKIRNLLLEEFKNACDQKKSLESEKAQ